MTTTFTPNQPYIDLLLENSTFAKRREVGTKHYHEVQKDLLSMELKLSSKEIIENTRYAFRIPE